MRSGRRNLPASKRVYNGQRSPIRCNGKIPSGACQYCLSKPFATRNAGAPWNVMRTERGGECHGSIIWTAQSGFKRERVSMIGDAVAVRATCPVNADNRVTDGITTRTMREAVPRQAAMKLPGAATTLYGTAPASTTLQNDRGLAAETGERLLRSGHHSAQRHNDRDGGQVNADPFGEQPGHRPSRM